MTDTGPIFVKTNKKSGSMDMFNGEMESLKALSATKTIRVPKPIMAGEMPGGGGWFAAEYLDMGGRSSFEAELGTQLARLHLHNSEMLKPEADRAPWVKNAGVTEGVKQFGFHIPTCCGFIKQENEWTDNWVDFFTEHRLQCQVNLLNKKEKIPSFFKDVPEISPALMHGDLWGGNISATDTEPVIFDPASFYGHSEYDLGIAMLFGGFSSAFFKNYHELIPRSPGFDRRNQLYQLFHLLNHWNHFGGSYKSQSLSSMKRLIKSCQ